MEKEKKNLKLKGILIYYIVLIIFVVIGFVVGCHTEERDGGYEIDYQEDGYNYFSGTYGKVWKSAKGEGFTKTKNIGWYDFTFMYENKYYTYLGDILAELPKEQARALAYANVPEEHKQDRQVLYSMDNDEDQFKKIYKGNITTVVVIFILLIIAPFILSLLFRGLKSLSGKHKENNKLSQLKKLNELKENGLISNEEYESRKEKLLK